jgi:hypothetical protein
MSVLKDSLSCFDLDDLVGLLYPRKGLIVANYVLAVNEQFRRVHALKCLLILVIKDNNVAIY